MSISNLKNNMSLRNQEDNMSIGKLSQHQEDPVLGKLPYAGAACSDQVRAAKTQEIRIETADYMAQARAIQALQPSVVGIEALPNVWGTNYYACIDKRNNGQCKRNSDLNTSPISITSWNNNNWDNAIKSICEQAAEAEKEAAKRMLEKIQVQIKLEAADDVEEITNDLNSGKAASENAPKKNNNNLLLGISFLIASVLLFLYIKKRR